MVDTNTRAQPAVPVTRPLRRRRPARTWRDAPSALRTPQITRVDLAVALLVLCGVVVWWRSITDLPLLAMTDVGLASVLPPGAWGGFGLVGLSFMVALRGGRTGAIVLSLMATVLVLHGLGVVAEPEMRFQVAWRHIGIADYIVNRGEVDLNLDAYQNWPAFFALTAFLWQATGVGDPTAALTWTPVAYNLLYLVPLVAIGHRMFRDRTVVWLAAWLFTVSNWIGQDYFSPQGWYLFIYLVVLAVLLEWFTPDVSTFGSARVLGVSRPPVQHRSWWRSLWSSAAPALGSPVTTPGRRTALLALVLLLSAVTIAGHQLTPFALVLGTGAAFLVGWSRLRALPFVVLLGTLAWIGYAAAAYAAGHPETFNQAGALSAIFEQTVGQRLSGSPGHELIVQLRLLATLVLWFLAAVGVYRLVRSGRRDLARGLAVLALSAFPLLAAQSYGGEALMRIAFFALPFMALLAAVGLAGPSPSTARRSALAPALVVGLLLVMVFPFTRYGNERMDFFMPDEVVGVQEMYRLTPPGSVITSVTGALPWRSIRYGDDDYRLLVDGNPVESTPDIGREGTVDIDIPDRAVLAAQVASRMASAPGQRSVLLVSRAQGAELDLMGPYPPGAEDRLLAALRTSPAFRTIYANDNVTVFELTGGARA